MRGKRERSQRVWEEAIRRIRVPWTQSEILRRKTWFKRENNQYCSSERSLLWGIQLLTKLPVIISSTNRIYHHNCSYLSVHTVQWLHIILSYLVWNRSQTPAVLCLASNIKNPNSKLKEGEFKYSSPHQILQHALLVINILNTDPAGTTAMLHHWCLELLDAKPLVKWKDLLSGQWKGPDPLLTSGQGCACIFPQDADSPI